MTTTRVAHLSVYLSHGHLRQFATVLTSSYHLCQRPTYTFRGGHTHIRDRAVGTYRYTTPRLLLAGDRSVVSVDRNTSATITWVRRSYPSLIIADYPSLFPLPTLSFRCRRIQSCRCPRRRHSLQLLQQKSSRHLVLLPALRNRGRSTPKVHLGFLERDHRIRFCRVLSCLTTRVVGRSL